MPMHVPMKAPKNIANPSVRNIDEGEERMDDIFQYNDLIGAWLKWVVVEITSDKKMLTRTLSNPYSMARRKHL